MVESPVKDDWIGKTGFWVVSRIHPETGTPYDPEGYDWHGYDRQGYDRQGRGREGRNGGNFNARKSNYDKQGFNADGIHKDTGKLYGPDGFNRYGVDVNGRNRDGELDPDVALALELVDEHFFTMSVREFAEMKNIEYNKMQERLSLASKKYPAIERDLKETKLHARAQAYAILQAAIEEVDTVEKLEEFYASHPRSVSLSQLNKRNPEMAAKLIHLLRDAKEMGKPELIMKALTGSRFNLDSAIIAASSVARYVEGEEKNILNELRDYLNKFKVRFLYPCRKSFDGGETWVDISQEDIDMATEALKSENKFLCARTIQDRILATKETEP